MANLTLTPLDIGRDYNGPSSTAIVTSSEVADTVSELFNYTAGHLDNLYYRSNGTTASAEDNQTNTWSSIQTTTAHRPVKLPTPSIYTSLTTELRDPARMPWMDYWKIVALAAAFFLCVALVLLVYFLVHRRLVATPPTEPTEQEPSTPYDYVYKPSQQGYIQEEYENTFVGVSIPLLQEVTKV